MEKLEDDILHASTYELFELREVIECHAVRQAARRADPLSIDRIKSAYEALRQSTSDRQSFLECDLNFHLTISKAIDLEATASFIYFIFEIMHKQFDLVATTQTTEYREKAVSSAGHVVSAIMTGDDALAVRCMRRHLDSAKHALRNNDAD
jgi:GntR family transcriptional repressor for pyruvate dehydrogenase complex